MLTIVNNSAASSNMFAESNFKTLVTVTNACYFFGIIPYYFKGSSGGVIRYEVVINFSKGRVFYQRFNLFMSIFYLLFLIFNLLNRIFSKDIHDIGNSLAFVLRMSYYVCAYVVPVYIQINTIKYREELPRFIQQYMIFFINIKGKKVCSRIFTIFASNKYIYL